MRLVYAKPLAPIAAESPVKLLCNGFVPDLQRIAGYAEVTRNEWLLLHFVIPALLNST
jgi:hypothetical protein